MDTEYSKDQFACEVLDGVNQNEEYKVHDDLIYYKNKIFLVPRSALKRNILGAAHDAPVVGHPGFLKNYHKVREIFTWKSLKYDVLMYVKEFSVCQQNKVEHSHLAGLLQPLPIPDKTWESVSMDFITGLPKSQGKDSIYVVVDKLTKYAHFFAVTSIIFASEVSSVLFKDIFRLHGPPKIIINDRDSQFASTLW